MKRKLISCLVALSVLMAGVMPLVVCADEDYEGRPSGLKDEEWAYLSKMRAADGLVRSELGTIRMFLSKPAIDDKDYRALVLSELNALQGYSGMFCTNAPRWFSEISGEYCDTVGAMLKGFTIPIFLSEPDTSKISVKSATSSLASLQKLLNVLQSKLDEMKAKLENRVKNLQDIKDEYYDEDIYSCGLVGEDCFIATAAYGTPATEEIDILRQFRDEFLLHNAPGKAFVATYYATSPPVAEFISEHEVLRTVAREGFVDPVVAVVRLTQTWWVE